MNIALIGVGALGKHHLQSLYDLKDQYDLYAVEVNPDTIKVLKSDFSEVIFCRGIDELPRKLAAVVISTNANVRRQVFEQLTDHAYVKNVVFEKVLFQKEDDYYFVKKRIDEKGIRAWVNCSRREWDSYKILKEQLATSRELYFSAIGGQWGMGSSTIHMLDLVEFLSGSLVENIDVSKLDNIVYESKRKGLYEFDGTITGYAGRCKNYMITSIHDSTLPFIVEINTENARYIIDEGNNIMKFSNESSDWNWIGKDFKQVYQSKMTGRVVRAIIENGTCNLPDFNTSMELHLKYLSKIREFFNMNGMEGDVCPIT